MKGARAVTRDYRLTPLRGAQQPEPGYAVAGRNKGVMARRRALKRSQAASRDLLTEAGDRRTARCPDWCGHKSHARPSRRGRQERQP
jgi:hypothetical protein